MSCHFQRVFLCDSSFWLFSIWSSLSRFVLLLLSHTCTSGKFMFFHSSCDVVLQCQEVTVRWPQIYHTVRIYNVEGTAIFNGIKALVFVLCSILHLTQTFRHFHFHAFQERFRRESWFEVEVFLELLSRSSSSASLFAMCCWWLVGPEIQLIIFPICVSHYCVGLALLLSSLTVVARCSWSVMDCLDCFILLSLVCAVICLYLYLTSLILFSLDLLLFRAGEYGHWYWECRGYFSTWPEGRCEMPVWPFLNFIYFTSFVC